MARTAKLQHDDDACNAETIAVTIELPRSQFVIVERPRLVSQRTSERVVGLPRRTYLEALRAYSAAGGEVFAIGKLRCVDVDAFVAWLRAQSKARPAPKPRGKPADPIDLEMERELRRRAGGRR